LALVSEDRLVVVDRVSLVAVSYGGVLHLAGIDVGLGDDVRRGTGDEVTHRQRGTAVEQVIGDVLDVAVADARNIVVVSEQRIGESHPG
jgi:hypothetical protein